jgi:hypothetical protein
MVTYGSQARKPSWLQTKNFIGTGTAAHGDQSPPVLATRGYGQIKKQCQKTNMPIAIIFILLFKSRLILRLELPLELESKKWKIKLFARFFFFLCREYYIRKRD